MLKPVEFLYDRLYIMMGMTLIASVECPF